MPSFKDIPFSVEYKDSVFPGLTDSENDVRRFICPATVPDLATLNLLKAEKGRATYIRSLGTDNWLAIIENGTHGILRVPGSGNGEIGATSEELTFTSAILVKINAEGAVFRKGFYLVNLEFTLPELVS